MTRFESTTALAIVALVGLAYSPAFGQFIEFDNGTKKMATDVKGPNGKPAKAPKAPRAPVAPQAEEPVEPTFTAEGEFADTREKAREAAVRAAVDRLRDYLSQQDPPVHQLPPNPTEFVRKQLLDKQETVAEEPMVSEKTGKTETWYKVTVAVHVEPDQVRQLRSRERSAETLWVLAGLGGLAAVGAVFFRIDAWTKGYLTSWLVLGTVGAAALLGGLWWWAK
jgi:hypothetical protein